MINALRKSIEQKKLEFTKLDAKAIASLIVLTALILLIPFIFRMSNLLIGNESYYFLRVAENPIVMFDELSYGGRTYIFSLWPIIISVFSKITTLSLMTSAKVISSLAGLISAVLFYFILRKHFNTTISFISSVILVLSPSFLYLFNTISDFGFVSLFFLLIFYLILRKNRLAFFLLLFIPLFGILHTIVMGILLIIYSFSRREFKWLYIIPLFALAILTRILVYGFPEILLFDAPNTQVLVNLVSDFGSFGLSLFTLILSIFGFSLLWEEKYKNMPLYLSVVLLLFLMNFNIKVVLYLSFFISFIATLGIIKIINIEWESKKIRNAIFYILIIGILFSFLTFFNDYYNQKPDDYIVESLEFLRKESNNNDIILSHYSRGHWISYFSDRKNFMDANFVYAPDVNERFYDFQELINTRNLEKAEEIADKYSIDYIWLDNEIKDQLWDERDEGLQFLLSYSTKFKKIYNQNNIEIWRVE